MLDVNQLEDIDFCNPALRSLLFKMAQAIQLQMWVCLDCTPCYMESKDQKHRLRRHHQDRCFLQFSHSWLGPLAWWGLIQPNLARSPCCSQFFDRGMIAKVGNGFLTLCFVVAIPDGALSWWWWGSHLMWLRLLLLLEALSFKFLMLKFHLYLIFLILSDDLFSSSHSWVLA